MIKQFTGYLLIAATLQLAGCGDETGSADQAAETMREATELQTSRPDAMQQVDAVPTTQGLVTFYSGTEEKAFGYLPAGHNTYTPMASSLHAASAASGSEQFRITFMAIDLASVETPAELPLPKKIGQPMSPMAAMANVGFSYTDADGNEWAGPATITLNSFADGMVKGTFSEATLPHTDQTLPDITLTNGSFEARLQ